MINEGYAPFLTDRSLVVLSVAKDLRLFPKVIKSSLGGVRGGQSPPLIVVMSNEVRNLLR